MALHVLVGGSTEADYLLDKARKGETLKEWVVPKDARPGDEAVFYFKHLGEFIAWGRVESRPLKSVLGKAIAYRADVHVTVVFKQPFSLEDVANAVPEWQWPYSMMKSRTTPSPSASVALETIFSTQMAKSNKVPPGTKDADQQEQEIRDDPSLKETEKQKLIAARQGQGLFRKRVMDRETKCRVTGVKAEKHLIASHIKPWKDCTNKERLDGDNGLLLSPHVDHLFDGGYISFTDKGKLLISSELPTAVAKAWNLV